MSKVPAIFDDENFVDSLTKILSTDVAALRSCASLLRADDFKPLRGQKWGRPRWIVAEQILEFYKKHHEPPGKLLRAELLDYAHSLSLSERQVQEIEEYLKHLKSVSLSGPTSVTEKVVRFKEERLRADILEQMVELQSAGQLTTENWNKLSQKATRTSNGATNAIDYWGTGEDRIVRRQRRLTSVGRRIPVFFIDPLDNITKGVGPGQLGVVIAPTGRGKSLWMIWLAIVFSIQNLNVTLVTLEDPREEVEERLDAASTSIPIIQLSDKPKSFRRRFDSYRSRNNLLKGRLRIIDGTEEGMTVAQIEGSLDMLREQGFITDVLLVDYDDEIIPETKHKEQRRFDSDETYRNLRRLAARRHMIVWTAAQTQRGTSTMKILTGDKVAEDLGKIRKASVALSIGKGDWGSDSFFVWIAKHKFSAASLGCHIVPNLECMTFYDRELTRQAALQYEVEEREQQSEEEL